MAASKTTLQFGFVQIPVRLETVVEAETTDSYTVCAGTDVAHDPVRVKQSMTCPTCSKSAPSYHPFPRGVERDGKLVVLDREELATAAPALKEMTLTFHPREDVLRSTMPGAKFYVITPQAGADVSLAILRKALTDRPELVAATVYAPRTKNAMWVIDVLDGRLVAQQRAWPEDVKTLGIQPELVLEDAHLKAFNAFLDATVQDFDPLVYRDTARQAREELVAARVDTAPTVQPNVDMPANVATDFLSRLEASVKEAQKAKRPAKKVTSVRKTTTRRKAS